MEVSCGLAPRPSDKRRDPSDNQRIPPSFVAFGVVGWRSRINPPAPGQPGSILVYTHILIYFSSPIYPLTHPLIYLKKTPTFDHFYATFSLLASVLFSIRLSHAQGNENVIRTDDTSRETETEPRRPPYPLHALRFSPISPTFQQNSALPDIDS